MGKTPWFEIYYTHDKWRWRLKAINGEKIASGESYERRVDLLDTLNIIDPRKLFPVKDVKLKQEVKR